MLAFRRGSDLVCAVNFTDRPLPLPEAAVDHRPLITSTPGAVDDAGRLAGDCTVWLSAS
jgi:alpha-glucosidase